jgi:16S rRNA (guanine966-N2)-methyltransferase
VRETLFNWLQGELEGAEVLDLFAGSGALGIEALSRGASRVTFVENGRAALSALEANLAVLGEEAAGAHVVRSSVWHFLAGGPPRTYGLVFLDPPYGKGLAGRAAEALEEGGWLQAGARIYLESGVDEGQPPVPAGWRPDRTGTCGEVAYRLYQRTSG